MKINLDLFTKILGESIKSRWERLCQMEFITLTITESQKRDIESLYTVKVETKNQQVYNDVILDILDILEIDYEVHIKKGLKIIGDK